MSLCPLFLANHLVFDAAADIRQSLNAAMQKIHGHCLRNLLPLALTEMSPNTSPIGELDEPERNYRKGH